MQDTRAARGWLMRSPYAALARLFVSGQLLASAPPLPRPHPHIPRDIVTELIEFVDGSSLATMAAVCKEWQSTARCEKHWSRLVRVDFGINVGELTPAPATSRGLYVSLVRARVACVREGGGVRRTLHSARSAQLHPTALMGALVGRDPRMMVAAASLGYRFR